MPFGISRVVFNRGPDAHDRGGGPWPPAMQAPTAPSTLRHPLSTLVDHDPASLATRTVRPTA